MEKNERKLSLQLKGFNIFFSGESLLMAMVGSRTRRISANMLRRTASPAVPHAKSRQRLLGKGVSNFLIINFIQLSSESVLLIAFCGRQDSPYISEYA